MPHARKAQAKHRPPLPTADPALARQRIVAVGVVQHSTTGHYQVWLHARGQTAMLLAFRTLEQADAAKHALGEALVRGEYATPERWVAVVTAIGTATDIPVEPVSNEIFAAINATIHGAAVIPPEAPMQPADAGTDDPPARDDAYAGGVRQRFEI
jgi:hypothetical protein